MPEFTVPGAYFSPLSSPALHAQTDHSSMFGQRRSGTENSPIDNYCDTHSAPGSTVIQPRRYSKKLVQKSQGVARAVRQSPIVKPRKNKRSMSSTIPAYALSEIGESLVPASVRVADTISTETSEEGSISPEHLSEMAPPPRPLMNGVGKSPSIVAQRASLRMRGFSVDTPATPASLLKLMQSPAVLQQNLSQEMDIDHATLERLDLPEAINQQEAMPNMDTSRSESTASSQATPLQMPLSAGPKTPGFGPLPSPVLAGKESATESPKYSPTIVPAASSRVQQTKTPATLRQCQPLKKRPLAATPIMPLTHNISPAILPRVSPAIKPLLPSHAPGSADETASLLLTSKSNYQNILEGNHLPGVTYPEELSTNLTSKRTSHKIAEQGRRNRINCALQEIAKLLPRTSGNDGSIGSDAMDAEARGDSGERRDKEKGSAAIANSKASTVECAINYIKQLQGELAEAKARAEKAEQTLSESQAGA